jgi:hypothetical protein
MIKRPALLQAEFSNSNSIEMRASTPGQEKDKKRGDA